MVISEPSPYFMGRLERRFVGEAGTHLIQGEVSDLVSANAGPFDAVFSVHVMEHIEDDRSFVRQQLELLRPGGRLIILVPALPFLYSELDKNIGHFRRYNKSSIRSLLDGAPAEVEKLFYSNFIGVLGSLYFSKFKKVQYQSSDTQRKKFFRIYQIFSRYFIPAIQTIENVIPVPLGLNLTLVATKRAS
jgi:SAM-dependent methyltransferase